MRMFTRRDRPGASSGAEPGETLWSSAWFRAFFPLAAFWAFVAALGAADWGHGRERALGLVAGSLTVLLLPRRAERSRLVRVLLLIAALILLAVRVGQGAQAVAEGARPTIDIGYTTIEAVGAIRAGDDPYTAEIDPIGRSLAPEGTGFEHFGGFKYGPVMAFAYLPGVVLGGNSGFYATQLVALVIAAAAARWWARRAAGAAAGWGAVSLTLVVPFIDGELFVGGVNDIVPVALMLLAFGARQTDRPVAAGLLIGLSFGAKLLPAGLAVLPLLLMRGERLRVGTAAAITCAIVYVPYLFTAPRELIASLLVFNLARPIDSTSLLFFVTPVLRWATRVVAWALSLWTLLSVRASAQAASVPALAGLGLSLFLLGAPAIHRNWLFGAVPLLGVAVAMKLWGEPETVPSTATQ